MPYVKPTFNLRCAISSPDVPNTPGIPTGPYRMINVPCALVYGQRVNVATGGLLGLANDCQMATTLLIDAGGDIRGPQDITSTDMVEVPDGSSQWYTVLSVLDIGKGWPNEHRSAVILPLSGSWIPPYV